MQFKNFLRMVSEIWLDSCIRVHNMMINAGQNIIDQQKEYKKMVEEAKANDKSSGTNK